MMDTQFSPEAHKSKVVPLAVPVLSYAEYCQAFEEDTSHSEGRSTLRPALLFGLCLVSIPGRPGPKVYVRGEPL